MGKVVRKLCKLLHVTIEPMEHEIDSVGQISELIRKAIHFHPMREITRRYHRSDFPKRTQRL